MSCDAVRLDLLPVCLCVSKQNFAAQYDGVKAPDPGPGPMVRMFCWCLFHFLRQSHTSSC